MSISTDFNAIHIQADKEGRQAAAEAELQMLTIKDQNGRVYDPFPICGFAWVKFAGNTAWGRWAKKNINARPGYPNGLQIWISDYDQSYDKKVAYARAYANVLKLNGIDAYGDGRLD